jgi:hypothetical protein
MQIIRIEADYPYEYSVCLYTNDEPNGDTFRVFDSVEEAREYADGLQLQHADAEIVESY